MAVIRPFPLPTLVLLAGCATNTPADSPFVDVRATERRTSIVECERNERALERERVVMGQRFATEGLTRVPDDCAAYAP